MPTGLKDLLRHVPTGLKDLLRHVPTGLNDFSRHVPTGLNDLWATRNVKVRNSEFLYETFFDDLYVSGHVCRRFLGRSGMCWVALTYIH